MGNLYVRGRSRRTRCGRGANSIHRHGRDHTLCVWSLRAEDELSLDKILPVDAAASSNAEEKKKPELLHALPVNALNFCAFSLTFIDAFERTSSADSNDAQVKSGRNALFAVPNALDSGGIDIFHLPSEWRISTISSDPSIKTGMVMAVNIFISSSGDLNVISAYEDGHVMAFVHKGPIDPADFEISKITSDPWKWEKLYASRPHSQPVLSLDVSPQLEYFMTSSADALIVKHPVLIPSSAGYVSAAPVVENSPLKTVNTKHSGQQGLRIRNDGKVFATAGWDSRVRVYSVKTMKELAVLKWHKEGCYAVTLGEVKAHIQSSPDQSLRSENLVAEVDDGQVSKNPDFSLAAVHDQRNRKIQQTHWLAAGSKDGKISLWDIY